MFSIVIGTATLVGLAASLVAKALLKSKVDTIVSLETTVYQLKHDSLIYTSQIKDLEHNLVTLQSIIDLRMNNYSIDKVEELEEEIKFLKIGWIPDQMSFKFNKGDEL